MTSRYSQYDSNDSTETGDDYGDDTEFTFTPYTAFSAEVDRVFKADSQFGQSLAIGFSDVEVIDGALYVDTGGSLKLFSWEDVTGLTPGEHADRGNELTAHDAPEVEKKKYGSTRKTYELVAAAVEGTDDIPASSASRTAELDEDGFTFSDWTDHGGDPIPLSEIGYDSLIMWNQANDEHGPSVASQRFAELLTEYGEDVIADENDAFGWLEGPVGDDMMRSDIESRRIEIFMTTRTSDNGYNYNVPVVLDSQTGEPLEINNREVAAAAGGSGN